MVYAAVLPPQFARKAVYNRDASKRHIMPAMGTCEVVPSERVKARWQSVIHPVEPKTKRAISGADIRDEPGRTLESWMCT
jgi:hypothetical protein